MKIVGGRSERGGKKKLKAAVDKSFHRDLHHLEVEIVGKLLKIILIIENEWKIRELTFTQSRQQARTHAYIHTCTQAALPSQGVHETAFAL